MEEVAFYVFKQDHVCRAYPNWMIPYFEKLTKEEQWRYFLDYYNVVNQLVSEDFWVDQLKWILKWPHFELEYDLYTQFMFGTDHGCEEVFKPGVFERWYDKYNQRFEEEFSEVFERSEVLEESLDDKGDELPF